MPLPKTASIAARATEVYSEAWSVLLQKCWGVTPVRDEELADLFQLLPYLRQLLTCCACAGLLENAMISLVCGHCYCYSCQYRDPLLKIQCRQCRERRGLVIETQIRLLVDCYKRMCLILASELNSNPLVLGVMGRDPAHCAESDKEKQKVSPSVKENGEGKTKSKTPSSAVTFNPISEILKEVQEGTKVSRAVLVIKPPSKYVNAKMMPTPRKEPSLSAKATAASSDKTEKESENNSPMEVEASEETTKKKRGRKAKRQLSLSIPYKAEEKSNVETRPSKEKVSKRAKEESGAAPSLESNFVTTAELIKTKLKVDNLKPLELEVSSKSLDSQLVKINGGRITIKEAGERGSERDGDYLPKATANLLKYVQFSLDKDGNRRRLWNPLCPRIFVKRSRASIDKMRNLQTKTVGARLRSKEKKKKVQTLPSDSPTEKTDKAARTQKEVEDPLAMEEERRMEVDMDERLEQLEREHGLQLPDIDTDIDPDLELDTSWLEELCGGIDEDFMYFAQPPVPPPPPPPPMPFPSPRASTPPHHPSMYGPPYSPQHHLPPPPHHHHFPPHHPPHPGFMHPPIPPPPHPHPFMAQHHPPLPPPPRHPPRPQLPPAHPPPIRIHRPTSPRPSVFPFRSKHQLPVIVGKMNIGKPPTYSTSKGLLSPGDSSKTKKRRSPGYSESGWRCRCGTNNVMFPEKVCAKGKCPCFSKGIPCKNCLCKHCHNPFNNEEEEEEGEEEKELTDQLPLDLMEEPEPEADNSEQVM